MVLLAKGKEEGLITYQITSEKGMRNIRELLVKCYVGEDDYFLDYIHNQIDDFELALAMDGKKNDIEKSCIRQRLEIMAKVANQIEKKLNNTIVHVSTFLSLPCLEIGKGKH